MRFEYVFVVIFVSGVLNSKVSGEPSGYLKYVLDILGDVVQNETNGIGIKCRRHLDYYQTGLETNRFWALQMFDATSKLPSGIGTGNTADLGSFEECIEVNQRIDSSNSLRGRYCFGETSMNLKEINATITLKLASCLPDSCSTADASTIYKYFGLNISFPENLCQTFADRDKLRFGISEYCGVVFFGIFALVIAASTTYDIYLYTTESQVKHQALVAFSILKNGKKLIAIENNAKQITCMNGIRVISTMWIILDHRYSVQFYFPLWNNFYKETWTRSAGNMFMINAQMAVDTFFLLSGILVTYVYLWSAEKSTSFHIFKFYLHRFLRLTPVLVAVIVFIVTLLRQFASGPLWSSMIHSQLIEGCEKYWWKTLLYIQNYDRTPSMCIPHGWYLSADMQLFVISPIFLLALSRWPKRTLYGIVALIVCNIVGCFLLGWFFELNGIMQGNVDFEKQMVFVWQYYFPAYTRAAPWLIGIILGYYLYLSKKKRYELSTIVAILCILSLMVMCAIVFGGHNLITSEYRRVLNAIYIALVRPAWALAVAAVIFTCANGYAGPVNWFLSLPIFEVLSRFTYTLYVVHYIVIFVLTSQMRTTVLFRNLEAMHQFWGDFAFTLFVATLVTLAFELPAIEIEKIIFAKKRTESTMTLEGSKVTEAGPSRY
ncbi:O-acyltransferase like protein-like isoform X2 [Photinus pyralis]|uniref:O-acyltransferase like protein-like isoform X2 n=1 Tax=Photinus pyralis TaxID=7054 RepID=UPI0012671DC8|nr:O-acyltransferase like protein-like isoform X2 [Photinus pyralis]